MLILINKAVRAATLSLRYLASSSEPDTNSNDPNSWHYHNALKTILHQRSLNAILKRPQPDDIVVNPLIHFAFKPGNVNALQRPKLYRSLFALAVTSAAAYYGGIVWAVAPALFTAWSTFNYVRQKAIIGNGVATLSLPEPDYVKLVRIDGKVIEGPLESWKFERSTNRPLNEVQSLVYLAIKGNTTSLVAIPKGKYTISNPTAVHLLLTQQYEQVRQLKISPEPRKQASPEQMLTVPRPYKERRFYQQKKQGKKR